MSRYIDIHTHTGNDNPGEVFSLRSFLVTGPQEDRPQFPYSIGIHPWQVTEVACRWLEELMTDDPNMVAIGEIGLDNRREFDPYDNQKKWFEKQVEIASEKKLPVIIHNVRAEGDILAVMKHISRTPWIVHGFTGSPESAMHFIDAGGYVSFGDGLLHSERTAEALERTPIGSVFFETDESETSIEEIYAFAAERLNMPLEALKEQIEKNFRAIFPNVAL